MPWIFPASAITAMWSRARGNGAASLHVPVAGSKTSCVATVTASRPRPPMTWIFPASTATPTAARAAFIRGSVCQRSVANHIAGALVHGGREAAERVDFAAVGGDAEMIARLRQRGALAPAIARGVVFLAARHRLAPCPAAEREQLVVDRRGCDLPAHGRHGCLLRPTSG